MATESFDTAFGRRLRELRTDPPEGEPATLDQVARAARFFGLNWQRPTVGAIESGRRSVSTKELLLLPMVLARATGSRATLLDLLSFHSLVTDQVEFGEGAAARLLSGEELDTDVVGFPKLWDAAKKALTDSTQRIRLITRHYPEAGRLGPRGAEALAQLEQVAGGEAEQKAARRLGLSATEMAAVALGLWGRGLTEERDDRTAALLEPGASTRTQQAVRGRVTRGLLAEVSDYLASIVAEGQDDGAGD